MGDATAIIDDDGIDDGDDGIGDDTMMGGNIYGILYW
jgi:hypothetical protein